MAKTLTRGVYQEKKGASTAKLRLKSELRARAAQLAERSDKAHHEAQKAVKRLRATGL